MGDARVQALCAVVPDAFGFLAEHGFSPGVHRTPEGRPSWDLCHSYLFASPERVVEMGLDPWGREVVTTIGSLDGSSAVDLEARYVALCLGPGIPPLRPSAPTARCAG